MANRLRPPIGRLSQAMIVLGICAVLVGALLNVRDLPFLQMVEGSLLDLRFIQRGPVDVDKNIELVVMQGAESPSASTTAKIASAIDLLVADGAEVIAVAPSLLVNLTAVDTTKLATSLSQVKSPLVGYFFWRVIRVCRQRLHCQSPRPSSVIAISTTVFRTVERGVLPPPLVSNQ